MLTEEQAIQLATTPEKITDERDINTIISYLNGYIGDLEEDRFEKELVASQFKVSLLRDKTKSVALAEAEFKVSEEYIAWQKAINLKRQYSAYRQSLRERGEIFMHSSKFIHR